MSSGGRAFVRRAVLGLLGLLASSVGLATALPTAASAAQVGSVSFSADSYLSADPAAIWTVGFTSSSSGALVPGDAVAVTFPSGFGVSGAVVGLATGFTGTGCSSPTKVVTNQTVQIVVPSNCALAASTAATVTISGLSATATQYSRTVFSVGTYADTTFTTVIDTAAYPLSPSSGFFITASIAYSATASDPALTLTGRAPSDASSPYDGGSTVTVLGNTGPLTLSGYVFAGWCTTDTAASADSCNGGTTYNAGDTFQINANTTLYSLWTPAPTYIVTYSTQASDSALTLGGSAPSDSSSPYLSGSTVTVLANTGPLTLSGFTFAGWCTTSAASSADGCTGTTYAAGATFAITTNTTLYSLWTPAIVSCPAGEVLTNNQCVSSTTTSSPPVKLAFTSAPLSVAPSSTPTSAITITLEDANGSAVPNSGGPIFLALYLPDTSSQSDLHSVVFASAPGATSSVNDIGAVFDPGVSSVTVYFGDSIPGPVTLTAGVFAGATNIAPATQTENIVAPPTTTVSLTAAPTTAELSSHVTITAVVATTGTTGSSGAAVTTPDSGVPVTFSIASGPDGSGVIGTAVTDSNGTAKFSFTNDGSSGADVVTASVHASGSAVSGSTSVDFETMAPYSVTLVGMPGPGEALGHTTPQIQIVVHDRLGVVPVTGTVIVGFPLANSCQAPPAGSLSVAMARHSVVEGPGAALEALGGQTFLLLNALSGGGNSRSFTVRYCPTLGESSAGTTMQTITWEPPPSVAPFRTLQFLNTMNTEQTASQSSAFEREITAELAKAVGVSASRLTYNSLPANSAYSLLVRAPDPTAGGARATGPVAGKGGARGAGARGWRGDGGGARVVRAQPGKITVGLGAWVTAGPDAGQRVRMRFHPSGLPTITLPHNGRAGTDTIVWELSDPYSVRHLFTTEVVWVSPHASVTEAHRSPNVVGIAPVGGQQSSYRLVTAHGAVLDFGTGSYRGPQALRRVGSPIVGIATTADGNGDWLVAADGTIRRYGDAHRFPARGTRARAGVVAIAPTPDSKGYWLVDRTGHVYPYGNARSYAAHGSRARADVVGIASTPDGKGYWLATATGAVVAYGDAHSFSAHGAKPHAGVVAIAATANGRGYWLTAADGTVTPYGNARRYRATGTTTSRRVITAMAPTADNKGYWLVTAGGTVLTYGDAVNFGSIAS